MWSSFSFKYQLHLSIPIANAAQYKLLRIIHDVCLEMNTVTAATWSSGKFKWTIIITVCTGADAGRRKEKDVKKMVHCYGLFLGSLPYLLNPGYLFLVPF
jgi:hypothetical protein